MISRRNKLLIAFTIATVGVGTSIYTGQKPGKSNRLPSRIQTHDVTCYAGERNITKIFRNQVMLQENQTAWRFTDRETGVTTTVTTEQCRRSKVPISAPYIPGFNIDPIITELK